MEFIKIHVNGNDFVVLDIENIDLIRNLNIKLLADRHLGIGFDQLLVLLPIINGDRKLVIYNQDGSEARNCGNGLIAIGFILCNKLNKQYCQIELGGQIKQCNINDDHSVTVNIGYAKEIFYQTVDLWHGIRPFYIDLMNKHAIFFAKDDFNLELLAIEGEVLEKKIHPDGINISVAIVESENNIKLKTWERGVGITCACGSACAATAYAYNAYHSKNNNPIIIKQIYGKTKVELTKSGILITSKPTVVFYGSKYQSQ
ncbi:MAG: diaminopimelate epimerase [Anaplasmataceae bacterium]|nr:diaminopimelate epimerase [Candidatus Heimdallarchaeota archaeon]MDH5796601.1 diaminopimelate epimerase [Anaplasmataceae bacterium]